MLRIEDTDRERSTPENVEQILDALRWLELDWDEGPLSQAERGDRHRARIAELVEAGRAYPDTATADDVRAYKLANDNAGYRGEPRAGEGAAIRLRVPDEGETVVEDLIRGPVTFENRLQDDFVIARGDGTPLYNFAVAVDDAEMQISHVIRGDDHLSNTPKQLLALEALGATVSGLRAPAAAARPGRQEALQAPRRRVGPGAARRRLPAGGAAQLPGVARLGRRRRPDDPLDPRARRAVLDRAGWALVGDLRRAQAALAQRPLHARAAARRVRRRPPRLSWSAKGTPRPRPTARRCAAPARSRRRRRRRSTELWPLIRFLFEPPVDDEKAWAKVMDAEAEANLRAAVEVLRSVEPVRRGRPSRPS